MALSKLIHHRRLSSSSHLHPHWRRLHYNILKPDNKLQIFLDHQLSMRLLLMYIIFQSIPSFLRFGLLLFPDSTSHSQLEFLPITSREVECEISWDDESILTVPDFPVTVTNASRDPLPCQFTSMSSYFQAVTELLCLVLISHETKECHVHWSHPQLERFKV